MEENNEGTKSGEVVGDINPTQLVAGVVTAGGIGTGQPHIDFVGLYMNENRIKEIISVTIKEEMQNISKIEKIIATIEIQEIFYEVPVWFENEEDMFVSFAPSLDIASQGETIIDAFENLKEAIQLYFEGEEKEFIKDEIKGHKIVKQ